jgi:hypothetical protein
VYDRLLGLDSVDWTARFKDDEKKQKEAADLAKKQGFTNKKPNTHPSHDLKDFAGDYENPGYGVAKIGVDGGRLRITFNGLSAPLDHFHYDTFEVPDDDALDFPRTKISFQTNLQGDIASLSTPLESSVKEIVFTRAADLSVMNRATLEPLAAQYQLGPAAVTVAMEGENALTLTVPGQPTYTLVPSGGLKFTVKGMTGFSIEFKKNEAGTVDQLVFYQPNGTFVAKRK